MSASLQTWPDLTALHRTTPDPTDLERVQHLVKAIDRLHEIATRFTPESLLIEELPQNAGCRCFGIVGEAAAGTSPAFRQAHPAVDWPRWTRYGRRLLRDYYCVNYKVLWQRWQPETQLLRQTLLDILAQETAASCV